MRPWTVLATVVIFASGCATSYQPIDYSGGYSERQTGEATFHVTFRGNAYTEMQRASDYTLPRSAEVALSHGFKFFIVVAMKRELDGSKYTAPVPTNAAAPSITSGMTYNHGEPSSGNTSYGPPGGTHTITKPVVTVTIKCFREKPEGSDSAMDAGQVSDQLKEKYGI
jgi:hypothetical protein